MRHAGVKMTADVCTATSWNERTTREISLLPSSIPPWKKKTPKMGANLLMVTTYLK